MPCQINALIALSLTLIIDRGTFFDKTPVSGNVRHLDVPLPGHHVAYNLRMPNAPLPRIRQRIPS